MHLNVFIFSEKIILHSKHFQVNFDEKASLFFLTSPPFHSYRYLIFGFLAKIKQCHLFGSLYAYFGTGFSIQFIHLGNENSQLHIIIE